MLRRNSGRWFLVLAVAVGLSFVPIAAASNAPRAMQTLTLLALVLALVAFAIFWLVMRQHGYVRASYLGIAALAGGFATALLFDVVPDFAGVSRAQLAARLTVSTTFNAVGLWLFALVLQGIFPRRNRGMAAAAIAFLLLGLFPGPLLLLQRSVAALNISDVNLQIHAAFLYWTVAAALMIGPFLALMTVPGDWFERGWARIAATIMAVSNRTFAGGAVLVTLALAVFFSVYSFDRRPTTADEIAQLWHARMLLEGRLAMPPDPNPEFFAIDNIIDRPHWMSQFPVGGPAVLALGMAFGAVWLLNPILTALITFNVYRFAQRAYGEPQARAAAAIVATSPMILIMGATHMNHSSTAWLVTLALAALPLWVSATDERARWRSATVIGAALGAAVTIRPLDGVVAGVVLGLLMLAVAARERERAGSLLIAMAAGAIPLALLLFANWQTTGHALRFGYEMLWGSNHSLGLHDDPTGHPHTAWRALLLAVKYMLQLNWISTSWPVPVLLIVAFGLALGRRPRPWDVLLLSLLGAQIVVYAFYWHDGQFVGPRFLFTAVPALLILAARAPFAAGERLRGVWRRIAIVLIPACIGVAWLRSMGPFGVQGLAKEFRESRTRLKLDPPSEVQTGAVDNALIFVQEGASARLLHRLWGIGLSRPDAARLFAFADACTLLEAVIAEEGRPAADTAGRLQRIERAIKPFVAAPSNGVFPDRNFRVTDRAAATPACVEEVMHDNRIKNTVAYGPMLLLNRFDDSGRVGGPAVYVMDLRHRNEVLRSRFGSRRWFRYEMPRSRPDTVPILVPY